MSNPHSALEYQPFDLVREVSPEAVSFYVDELSGIYLPDEFKAEHADNFYVKSWKAEDRLLGKFGRFTVAKVEEDKEVSLDDILVMGTTIGLRGLDRYNDLHSLRHFELLEAVRGVIQSRGLIGEPVGVKAVDYGSTKISVKDGAVTNFAVGSRSIDFGRATAEVRQNTCEAFNIAFGGDIEIVNADPEPQKHDRIIE